MKNIITILAAAAISVAVTQSVQATPIQGTIAFSGTCQLDSSSSVASSTEVTAWSSQAVGVATLSGSFVGLTGNASMGSVPWAYSTQSAFWTIGLYSFSITSTPVVTYSGPINGNYSETIFVAGTVTYNGGNSTAMAGTITIQDPSNPLNGSYSDSMSFNTVPDGGTTALLLGSALSGLALIRRKLNV